ncbi:MAG: pyridoxamine 5'-phosphate oxidase family protein [Planctomycetaceae bacterium]|nr:pyridoxamine 5'-phosphate oxidase family protein [Planctomycetaceae bacterium]
MKVDYSEVRRLLRLGSAGALGTQSASVAGYPFTSSLPYALDGACRPLFLISGLAEHTRNLLADPRASLLVFEGEGGRLDQARVTLLGRVLPVTLCEEVQARYLRYQPEAAGYLALGDFRFFRMEPDKARFIGGFGRMSWVDPESYVRAEADPLADASPGIVSHMNEDHPDAVLAYARALAGIDDATEAAMRAAGEAVLLLGSRGYSSESPVERHFRDAQGLRIYEGTSLVQRIILAREILGKEGS